MQSAVLAIVNPSVCLSVCLCVRPSVTRWHCVKMTQATITRSSLEDNPMTLVSHYEKMSVSFVVDRQNEINTQRAKNSSVD